MSGMGSTFQKTPDNDLPCTSKKCEDAGSNGRSKKELFENSMTTKLNVYSSSPTPLPSAWTLWTSSAPRRSGKEEYMSGLQKVNKVFTLSEFWNSHRSMVNPSELGVGVKISMMRDDRIPLWEDPQNQDGGSFVARLEKKQIDWVWEQLLLLAIGEELQQEFHPEDKLTGLSVCEKRWVFVLTIWNERADKANSLHSFLRNRFPFLGIHHYYYNAHKNRAAFVEDGEEGQEKMKYEPDWRKV